MIETEMAIKKRVVYENESFFAFVPFFAEYPYQIFIYSKRHIQTLLDFRDKEKEDMGEIIQTIVKMYDSIFDMLFPYMMAFHQAPVDEKEYDYFHFHIEFYPPLRNKQTQKFNASSETGAWVHGNPASPEDKAAEMREIIKNIK
jgi:UDPglucose--hexose-1-phosphate uridylyltransferase